MSDDPIRFTKVRLPWGWLSNMSPHPITYTTYSGHLWRTAEHLFQALRFSSRSPVRGEIYKTPSPMAAKMIAHKHSDQMDIARGGAGDLDNMRRILEMKIEQHPELKAELLSSGDRPIIEDVSARPNRRNSSALFWGAALVERPAGGVLWEGENRLGRMWMDIREELRNPREPVDCPRHTSDPDLIAAFKVAESALEGDIYRDAPPGTPQAFYQDIIMELRRRGYVRQNNGEWTK